ncbi:hypothetical protein [Streptomyces griseoaurantiacus]|uniref:hypothetical protein n=1 Tax=Streptomyces griseoaurantiacus TaxID=68213 RepID=UPI002E2CFF70|nr:hypothetical protein [Streptomyces jietaisiensis]
MQYDQWATAPDGGTHYIATGECAGCSTLATINSGYSCIQDGSAGSDCSGVWYVTAEAIYEAPPGFEWAPPNSNCEVAGQILTCTASAKAGTAALFSGPEPVRCTETVTTNCVHLPTAMREVPRLSEKALTDIYNIHYVDVPAGVEPAQDKSAFYAGTTPSRLQKILLKALEGDSAEWQPASSGYYEKDFTYYPNGGGLSEYVGVKSANNGGADTADVTVVADAHTGQVITMYPK